MKVIVLIIPGYNSIPRTSVIKSGFSSSIFKVVDLSDSIFDTAVSNIVGMSQDNIYEANKLLYALRYAYNNYNGLPVIVIKDNSVINVSSREIESITNEALSINNWDLFYYCTWFDMCQLRTIVGNNSAKLIATEKTTLQYTSAPNGFQCIMFRSNAIDIMLKRKPMLNSRLFNIVKPIGAQLNDEIYSMNLIAIVSTPNLVDFDIVLNARTNADYSKLSTCDDVVVKEDDVQDNTGTSFFFIVLFISAAIFLALIKIGPRSK